jgi:hypothetical protein
MVWRPIAGSISIKYPLSSDPRQAKGGKTMAGKIKKEVIFDGFDPTALYQMVPLAETRGMAVVADSDGCTIVIDPPDIARMEKFVFPQPLLDVPREFRASVTPNNTLSFNLFGIKKGNTNLFILNKQSVATSVMRISVKEKIRKTYTVGRLSDIRHLCPFLPEEVPVMLRRVEATYLQQANIQLDQIGGQSEIVVTKNLGNPIILDTPDRANFNAIFNATPNSFWC